MQYVTDLRYGQQSQFDNEGNIIGSSDVLVVETEDNVFHVPNGDFTTENPALQLLAYIGERPSTIDSYSLESDDSQLDSPSNEGLQKGGATVPVVWGLHGPSIAQIAFGNGKSVLSESDWGPMVEG
jgi:hypothetical protein